MDQAKIPGKTVRLLAHAGFKRYLRNASWLFAEQLLRMGATLLVTTYVARFLGPIQFGIYSYALALVALFGGFAKLGLDGIVVRYLVNHPAAASEYLGSAFWLKVFGGGASLVGVILASLASHDDSITTICVAIIAAGLLFQAFEVIDFYFQSNVESKYVSICRVTQLLVSSAAKVALVLFDAGLIWFAATSLLDQVTLAIFLYLAYKTKTGGKPIRFMFAGSTATHLLKAAGPLIVAGIMVSVYTNIDRVLIAHLLDAKIVGFYAAAASLTAALYFIPTIVSNSLFPAILNSRQSSAELYEARLSYLYKFLLTIGLVVCVASTILAVPVIRLLYGPQYLPAAAILQVYVWNFLFVCFSSVFGKWILAEELQHLSPRFTAFAMVANVVACYVLIPLLAQQGAALASLAAQAIPLLWYGVFNNQVNSQLRRAFGIDQRRQ